MTDVAVRGRDQLHVMPLFRPLHRHAGGAILRIVRMSTEHDDAQFAVAGLLGRSGLGEGNPRLSIAYCADDESQSASRENGQHRNFRSRTHITVSWKNTE